MGALRTARGRRSDQSPGTVMPPAVRTSMTPGPRPDEWPNRCRQRPMRCDRRARLPFPGSPADAMNPAAELSSPMGNHYADLAAPGNASQAADRLKAGRPEDGPSTRDADGSESNGSESGNLPNEPLAGDASGDSVPSQSLGSEGLPGDGLASRAPSATTAASNPESSQSGAPSGSSSPSGAQPSQAMQQLQNTQGAQQMQGSPTMTGSPVMMDQKTWRIDPRMSPPPTMDFNMQPPSGVTAELGSPPGPRLGAARIGGRDARQCDRANDSTAVLSRPLCVVAGEERRCNRSLRVLQW